MKRSERIMVLAIVAINLTVAYLLVDKQQAKALWSGPDRAPSVDAPPHQGNASLSPHRSARP